MALWLNNRSFYHWLGEPLTGGLIIDAEDSFEFKLGARSSRSRGGSMSRALQGGSRPSTAERSRRTSERLGSNDGNSGKGALQGGNNGGDGDGGDDALQGGNGTLQGGGSEAGGTTQGEIDAAAPDGATCDGLDALDESDTLIVVRD